MNTEIEKIKKDVNSIVAFLASNTHILIKNSDLIAQIVNRQHTQPEGYQGLNKWYKTKGGHIIFAVSINNFNCYGIRVKNDINKNTHWCNDFALQLDNIDRLATESEIIEAIKKGLEQKGIVEGARVNPFNYLVDNLDTLFEESDRKGSYCIKNSDGYYVRVFDNGTFAEVVKEEKKKCDHFYKVNPDNKEQLYCEYCYDIKPN